jgi:uncharacterized protein (DUF1800 family)
MKKNNCANLSLTEFIPNDQNPWNEKKILFLFRRLEFGIDKSNINTYLNYSPQDLIDKIIDDAKNLTVSPDPGWRDWNSTDFNNSGKNRGAFFRDHQRLVFDDFLKNGFRDRLTLFWSNHFVTEYYMYNHPAYAFRYYNNIQKNVLGNFKEFVREIGLDDAMLMYLNGFENKNSKPNENYSRELYELFTLGEGNGYTQEDITETSRALTGYNTRTNQGPISFNDKWYDDGEKTIFGRTGNWNYDDVIEILFEEKKELIGKFICTKLYKYFVNPNVNEQVVSDLSNYFIENNFSLDLLYKKIFKSEHFFDSFNNNVIVKSPVDLLCSLFKQFKFEVPENFNLGNYFIYKSRDMGQEVLNPVDVAGWQGNHDWISTGSLPMRWDFIDDILWKFWQKDKLQYQKFLKSIVGENETNPQTIVKKVIDFMFCDYDIKEEDLLDATEVFKSEVPDIYYEDGTWNINDDTVPQQTYRLIGFLTKLPEYQLK